MKRTFFFLLGCIAAAFAPFVIFYVLEYFDWLKKGKRS